jgi:hypothetical protein
MRLSDYDMKEALLKIQSKDSMQSAEKVIYQWVKEDKISPAQMSDLLITAYKKFVY